MKTVDFARSNLATSNIKRVSPLASEQVQNFFQISHQAESFAGRGVLAHRSEGYSILRPLVLRSSGR